MVSSHDDWHRMDPDPGVLGLMVWQAELELLHELREVPGVVRLVDGGETGEDGFFLVLRPEPGRRLATCLRQSWPPRRLHRLLGGLLEVLAALHDRHVVHGALTPDVVHVRPDERPVLDGFGPAAARGRGLPASQAPAVVAPEVAGGAPPGPAADVYAVGCLAYAAISGRMPFERPTDDALVAAHRYAPVARLVPRPGEDLSPDVASWVLRLLAKRPDVRFGDARSARAALPLP